MFPEYQEEVNKTPRKRAFENSSLKSQLSDLMTPKESINQSFTPRKHNTNALSIDNPLNKSAVFPTETRIKKDSLKNKVSTENPLNYKVQPAKSQKVINTKVTASRIGYLPGSIAIPSPPRIVKIRNSESQLDFLPGSFYSKAPPEEISRKKNIIDPNLPNLTAKDTASCKKLKKNKLMNGFNISYQFEP